MLFILGLSERIADLADVGTDSLGLQLDEERLPQRVSPAYDMNPTPLDVKAHILSLAIDEADDTASLDVALGKARQCGLKLLAAKEIIGEVQSAVAQWRICAASHGLTARDIGRMASAFEHHEVQGV